MSGWVGWPALADRLADEIQVDFKTFIILNRLRTFILFNITTILLQCFLRCVLKCKNLVHFSCQSLLLGTNVPNDKGALQL